MPLSIRRRFSRRVADGNTVVYVGEILETRMSITGLVACASDAADWFAVSGLPESHMPCVVSVTEDMPSIGGQTWTLLYARRRRFPQIVYSSKRFAGPTGFEDHVGYGVGMTLTYGGCGRCACLSQPRLFRRILRAAHPAADLATPGALSVTHAECADGRFSFTLDVVHPRFGLLIRQMGLFREARP